MPDDFDHGMHEAQRETESLLAADAKRSVTDPTLPVYQYAARESLEHERERFDAGDKVALLGAIRICANHDLVMPEWVARAFIRSYDKVLTCRTARWDDAFGRPFPKGTHISAARKRRLYAVRVRLEIDRAHKAGRAIDEQLFSDVGSAIGQGKTQVSEYYYGTHRLPQKKKNSRKDKRIT